MICRHKLYHFMVANLVLPRRVSGAVKRVFATVKWYNLCLQIIQTQIVLSPFWFILIKRFFKTFSLRWYLPLLRMWRRRCFHGINAMILMPQISDVTANENARYKRNELELSINVRWRITNCVNLRCVGLRIICYPLSDIYTSITYDFN